MRCLSFSLGWKATIFHKGITVFCLVLIVMLCRLWTLITVLHMHFMRFPDESWRCYKIYQEHCSGVLVNLGRAQIHSDKNQDQVLLQRWLWASELLLLNGIVGFNPLLMIPDTAFVLQFHKVQDSSDQLLVLIHLIMWASATYDVILMTN